MNGKTARVLQFRQATPEPARPSVTDPPATVNLTPDATPRLGVLGGDCLCGRGETIGTCIVTASRLWFRAFHEPPAVYHLERVTDWVCVDCLADSALDVAQGVIREQMQETSRKRAAEAANGQGVNGER
ncbi:hypothetical protein AB0L55_37475 [Streptomyces anthocyanicus]|uniref:hypothetical protein n=1 Tax=Streptomyces anthocyanicus TaxID=68174 RepID=UPI003428851D